jgi:hypothetical protein
MAMTEDEFVEAVAALVAGLQVPVSMMPRHLLGAAFEPWQRLIAEATGGFGWTDKDHCREAFTKIVRHSQADARRSGATQNLDINPPGFGGITGKAQ